MASGICLCVHNCFFLIIFLSHVVGMASQNSPSSFCTCTLDIMTQNIEPGILLKYKSVLSTPIPKYLRGKKKPGNVQSQMLNFKKFGNCIWKNVKQSTCFYLKHGKPEVLFWQEYVKKWSYMVYLNLQKKKEFEVYLRQLTVINFVILEYFQVRGSI